ncbi:YtcA family lipoprotein [Paenochrobactrum sp. BZR 588]|uniref:YtcA family lipoprotein n=1 Tax=Paenochrobactrum TaxID=999488 RepID=UPI0035BC6731
MMVHSPTFYMVGAFFPTWMICLAGAIAIVLIIRMIFIRTGLEELLTFRLITYTAMVVAIAFALAFLIYGH